MMNVTAAARGALMVHDHLKRTHDANRTAPLICPDAGGVFPDSWLGPLLRPEVLIAVVDTNWLRADLKYACLRGHRTVLVSGANSRALRLYCAEHVVLEVDKYLDEWAVQFGVSSDELWGRWENEYLPFLNVIPKDSIPLDILSSDEMERIQVLAGIDRDDIPSVTLSLALEAIFLSKDKPAFHAVYGPDADYETVYSYVDVLMAGSDSGALGEMLFSYYLLIAAAGYGAVQLVKLLSTKAPWLLGGLGAAAAFGMLRIPAQKYKSIGKGFYDVAAVLNEIHSPYYEFLEQVRLAEPKIPSLEQLAQESEPRARRLRACLHKLARSPQMLCSASELAEMLPDIKAGTSETMVRQTLSQFDCFARPVKGKWKVGHTFRYPQSDDAYSD